MSVPSLDSVHVECQFTFTHTHHLLHTVTDHLSRIIFHTTLSHALFHTHTHHFHTQLCHTHTIFLCHTPSFTHNFVTHTHTIFLCHTQLCHTHTHTPSFFVTHQLSHATLSHTTSTTSFVFPSFPVPATTFLADYWKKLTCGVIRSFIFLFLIFLSLGATTSSQNQSLGPLKVWLLQCVMCWDIGSPLESW